MSKDTRLLGAQNELDSCRESLNYLWSYPILMKLGSILTRCIHGEILERIVMETDDVADRATLQPRQEEVVSYFFKKKLGGEGQLLHLGPLLLNHTEIVANYAMPVREHFELALLHVVAAGHLVKI